MQVSAYVAMADILTAAQPGVQHKNSPLVTYVVGVSCRQSKL